MSRVTVYTAFDDLALNSVRDLLREAGIPAVVSSNFASSPLIPLVQSDRSGDVLVDEADAERALELISGFLGSLGELAEVDAEDPAPES